MELTERTVSSQTIFQGRIIRVDMDQVELPDGKTADREVVYHPGGVAVLALDRDNSVSLVRQFRYPIRQELLELPAGKLDHGAEEDRLLGAKRELSEETGLEAEKWTYLGYTLASPGFCDEAIHLYLAEDLTFGQTHPDEDEFLLPERIPLDQLVSMALDGTLIDGKSVIGVLKTALLRKGV